MRRWWSGPLGLNVLERLQESSARTAYRDASRDAHTILFARSGFTLKLLARADEDTRVILMEPEQLLEGPGSP